LLLLLLHIYAREISRSLTFKFSLKRSSFPDTLTTYSCRFGFL
jgi:hypothetical protein